MCQNRKDYLQRSTDLNHVKIIAKATSNLRNEPVGIWFDGTYYKFEVVGGRSYLMITELIDGVWQWQV